MESWQQSSPELVGLSAFGRPVSQLGCFGAQLWFTAVFEPVWPDTNQYNED